MSDKHPMAEHHEQLSWAVWIESKRSSECISVVADSEDEAIETATERSSLDPHTVNVDGPFGDSEPAVFEFEYRTEHVERVVVEAPNENYAKECADHQRDYHGEYKRTMHTEVERIPLQRDKDE